MEVRTSGPENLCPHFPQLRSGLGEGKPHVFGQRDGSGWQVLGCVASQTGAETFLGLSPARNKDAVPSFPAHLLSQRTPLPQPDWALGGWIHLHNVLKRGN